MSVAAITALDPVGARRVAVRRVEPRRAPVTAAPATRELADPVVLAATVRCAQAGNPTAQRELVIAYQRRIAGFVFVMLTRSNDVEDMCQRIFIRMVRALPTLREASQFEAWLFRLARHMCIDQMRRDKLRRIFTPFLAQHTEVIEPDGQVDSEELDALRHALAQMPERERTIVALLQEGRSYREIGEFLSINEAAAKARVHRARVRLRLYYEARR